MLCFMNSFGSIFILFLFRFGVAISVLTTARLWGCISNYPKTKVERVKLDAVVSTQTMKRMLR
jgi:hypothetical protein